LTPFELLVVVMLSGCPRPNVRRLYAASGGRDYL